MGKAGMSCIFAVMDDVIINAAKRTIAIEADTINHLADYLNDGFINIIKSIYSCTGRVVLSGVGKSGIVAQKIVATLNSTGTPSVFMHAADAIHGDLGIVQKQDIVLLISQSGESAEIKVLAPLIKNFGNILIGATGNPHSYLALHADYILHTTVISEACPNNLAPTSSTTAQMVLGDAIAVCLMELKGFNGSDFAKLHPGGNLGKRLYLKVKDLYIHNLKPSVSVTAPLRSVIMEMTGKRLGATAVTDNQNNLLGIITDGDLRRMLERTDSLKAVTAADILFAKPKTINENDLAISALEMLRNNDISQLLVVDNNKKYLGILHLHDLIKEGIV